MKEIVVKALSYLSEEDAKSISEKHSEAYIEYYFRKALSHENSGKLKGDLPYYLMKLLTKDKARFYEKENRKKEILAQKTEQKRRAQLKVKKRLDEVKNRENLASDQFKQAKDAFRALSEIEQNRHVKRVQKQFPDLSFNQARDKAVMIFYNGR